MASYTINNQLQMSQLQEFRSVVGKGNDFAKVARFAVQINGVIDASRGRDLIYLCEAAELPGRALNVDDVRYYGPSFKLPFQSAYVDINLTFLVRNNMLEKEFFDNWLEQINPKNSYNFEYRDNYATSIDIWQFDEVANESNEMQTTYKIRLEKAYPIFVNPLPTNWADDNIHRLQVTFAYLHWTTETERESVVQGTPGSRSPLQQSDGTILSRWQLLPR